MSKAKLTSFEPRSFPAGLLVMEILIPVFWLSDSLVEGHHKQVQCPALWGFLHQEPDPLKQIMLPILLTT